MQPGPWGIHYLLNALRDDRTRAQRAEPEELPSFRPEAWAAWAAAAPVAAAEQQTVPTKVEPQGSPILLLPDGTRAGTSVP